MTGRLEYKYLVPDDRLPLLRRDIAPYVDLDPFVRHRDPAEYTVRSIYFDTPHLACFEDKIEGIRIRRKFRLRSYNDPASDSLVFLEIKRKYANYVSKDRAALTHAHLEEFMRTLDVDRYVVSSSNLSQRRDDACRFVYHYCRDGLSPTALVVYDREAFVGRFEANLRLTFDKNLRSICLPSLDMLFCDSGFTSRLRGYFVLEVKFYGGLPSWLLSAVRRYSLARMAISKYAICLERGHAPRCFRPDIRGIRNRTQAATTPSTRESVCA
ncbi:MAG: polyphosphate polymerase domain-containing protein [candidate division Zixibacteria bacterium]|nr:polyphosphate polymerase domain-containing protein [candidate division Zixibacteria bacterium]